MVSIKSEVTIIFIKQFRGSALYLALLNCTRKATPMYHEPIRKRFEVNPLIGGVPAISPALSVLLVPDL